MECEGEAGFSHIDEYADTHTERGQKLRKILAERFNFATLEFQSLEGIIKAIGIDRSKLCTYCWSGNKADFGSSYKANPAITNPEQPAQSENPTQPTNPEQSSQKENSGIDPCLKQNSQPNPDLKN